MGMMLETTSKRIFKKGHAHYKCPDKVPSKRIRTIEIAGEMRVPFTTGILIGIGETWEDRIDSLLLIECSTTLSVGAANQLIMTNGTFTSNFQKNSNCSI